ncbi:RNA-binding protein 39-like [Callorhinchus milii]|nr:RNA-binding protein 39-like [Callorhinchus milii]
MKSLTIRTPTQQTQGEVVGIPVNDLPPRPLSSQCIQLSNLLHPLQDTSEEREVMEDVIEECNKYGGVIHIHLNSAQGDVYIKCPTVRGAELIVNVLNGRWFAGRMISAVFVPVARYHKLFPESVSACRLVLGSHREK